MLKKIRIILGLVILFSFMIWFSFYIDEKTSSERAYVKADVESVERAVNQSDVLSITTEDDEEEYEPFDNDDTE